MNNQENIKSFCLKCRQNKNIKDIEVKTSKNNRQMLSGVCMDCNTKTCKFLKREKTNINNKEEELKKEDEVKVDEVKVDEVKDIIEKFEKKIKQVNSPSVKKPLIE